MNSIHHHYNPDWVDDDSTVANFVARMEEFTFLRNELARAPGKGTVQHYLLVGVRGAGKTTLLKRLAVSIRRDADLQGHLIALSFPEELYQVKNLSDFWWAACDALADELDHLGMDEHADRLDAAIEQVRKSKSPADAGLQLLLEICAELKCRPVLLVDNLDLVFQRIDKSGRKLKDPHAAAYWELREALSSNTAPIVIGGTVRLSEPFTDYDKAFYDFFIPKRLGKLGLEEVRQVLERLADAQGVPEVKQRLRERPSRIEALYELTGGNPRALGLILDLLRNGPSSRAVEDFERLMDITTPYYKARFEDLSEQAQVVMHALAVRRPGDGSSLRFGHTAAEIGKYADLPTGTVSAQLDILEREGLVEKSSAHGRTQYRIAEQLFRLWLQMRSTRRIRQNVIDLTQFLEAMFDLDELQAHMSEDNGASLLSEARYAFAIAGANYSGSLRKGLEAYGVDHVLQHLAEQGGNLGDYLSSDDLSEDMAAVMHLREQLQQCDGGGLSKEEQEALLGSLEMNMEQKQASVKALCTKTAAQAEVERLRPQLDEEYRRLLRHGLKEVDLPLLYCKRAKGLLSLPKLMPQDVESACVQGKDQSAIRAMLWRLVGAREWVKFVDDADAQSWLEWGLKYANEADSIEWANVAGAMRLSGRIAQAQQALEQAFKRGESSRAWYERAVLLDEMDGDATEVEATYRKAIELAPEQWPIWVGLGKLLSNKLDRYKEAEAAYLRAIQIEPANTEIYLLLAGMLIIHSSRYDEAEAAILKAIEFKTTDTRAWGLLGALLAIQPQRQDDAIAALQKAAELDSVDANAWNLLGLLLESQSRLDEALAAYVCGAKLDKDQPSYIRESQINLLSRICANAAQQALETNNQPALHEAMNRLPTESPDIAATLVSTQFVESFLAPLLKNDQSAKTVLDVMRDLGYEKYARPMLLAFEAAMTNRQDMLDELEPEIQGAAKHMFDRLIGKKPKKKRASVKNKKGSEPER